MKKFAVGIGLLIVLAIVLGSIDWVWDDDSDTNNPSSEEELMDSSNDG